MASLQSKTSLFLDGCMVGRMEAWTDGAGSVGWRWLITARKLVRDLVGTFRNHRLPISPRPDNVTSIWPDVSPDQQTTNPSMNAWNWLNRWMLGLMPDGRMLVRMLGCVDGRFLDERMNGWIQLHSKEGPFTTTTRPPSARFFSNRSESDLIASMAAQSTNQRIQW